MAKTKETNIIKQIEKEQGISDYNFSEMRYYLIRKLISESGTVDKQVLNSYRGSSNYSLIFEQDLTQTAGQDASKIERYIINDNMAELFYSEINLYFMQKQNEEGSVFNKITQKIEATDLSKEDKSLLEAEIQKLLAYLMHINNGKSIDSYISDLKEVFANREDKEFNKQISLIEDFLNGNKELIQNTFEQSQEIFKNRFINNEIDEQLITIKSNETLKKKIVDFYEYYLNNADTLNAQIEAEIKALKKENQKENQTKIKKLEEDKKRIDKIKENVDLEKFNSGYNFDTIFVYKDFFFTNEIKSGVSSIVTKFLANFSGIKEKSGLIESLTLFFLYKDIVPEMFESKKLWKDSLEYRNAENEFEELTEEQKLIENEKDKLSEESIEEIKQDIYFKHEIAFIKRIIENAQEFRTYEDIHIHIALSKEENKNEARRTKALKERLNLLSLTEQEYIGLVGLPEKGTIKNLNIYFKSDGVYTIQVNDRLANIYLSNISKDINYKRMTANFEDSINLIREKSDIANFDELKQQILENIQKNEQEYNYVTTKDFLNGIQDIAIQSAHYLVKECDEHLQKKNIDKDKVMAKYKGKNYIDNVITDIDNKLKKTKSKEYRETLEKLKNTFEKLNTTNKIENIELMEFLSEWKKYLKTDFSKEYGIKAGIFDSAIFKNATISASLDLLLIDKDKKMFDISKEQDKIFKGIDLSKHIQPYSKEGVANFQKLFMEIFNEKDKLSINNHSAIPKISSLKLNLKNEVNSSKIAKNLYMLIHNNSLENLLSSHNQKPVFLPEKVELILQLARISKTGDEYYKELEHILKNNAKYIKLVLEKRGTLSQDTIKELNVFNEMENKYNNFMNDELNKLSQKEQEQFKKQLEINKTQFKNVYESHLDNVLKILDVIPQSEYEKNKNLKFELENFISSNINNIATDFIKLTKYKDSPEIIEEIKKEINSKIVLINEKMTKIQKDYIRVKVDIKSIEEVTNNQKIEVEKTTKMDKHSGRGIG